MNSASVVLAEESPAAGQRARFRGAGYLWSGLLLAILAFLVLYPIGMLLYGALTGANPVVDGFHPSDISLSNFVAVLINPNVGEALANSFIACTGGTALAVCIGLAFAWIVVRTNTPLKGVIATAGLLAALRAAARRRRRLGDPRIAAHRAAQHGARRDRHLAGASTSIRCRG